MVRTATMSIAVLLSLALAASLCSASAQQSPLSRPATGTMMEVRAERTVPGTVWYQGFLANVDTGDPVNDTVEIVAELFDAAVDGSSLWGPETHGGTVVTEGWFHIELGSIESPLPDFSSPPYYLQLTINGEPMGSRMKMASAPTAIRAGEAEGGGGGGIGGGGDAGYVPVFSSGTEIANSNMYETSGRFSIGTTTSDAKLRVENAGDLPVLKLVNTSANGGTFPLVTIERSTAVNVEPLLSLKTPGSAGNYHLFEIEQTNAPGDSLLVWINGQGLIGTAGGLYVDEPYWMGVYSKSSYAGMSSGAVYGECTATDSWDACGIYGSAMASDGYGTGGIFWGGNTGVEARVMSGTSTSLYGLFAQASGGLSSTATGVYGGAVGSGTNYGVYGTADYGTEDWAGYFDGDVYVDGTVTSSKAGFRIDHPGAPANAYLSHAHVASSEQKTVYDGMIRLDADGTATVELPEWFETLNGQVRYQLTPVGAAAPDLHIARKVSDGSFDIAGGAAGLEVCWQVTGVRHDPASAKHVLTVVEPKVGVARGKYLDPALYGATEADRAMPRPEPRDENR